MAAINLFKTPKQGAFVAAERPARQFVTLKPPALAPVISPSTGGLALGGQAVFGGIF